MPIAYFVMYERANARICTGYQFSLNIRESTSFYNTEKVLDLKADNSCGTTETETHASAIFSYVNATKGLSKPGESNSIFPGS